MACQGREKIVPEKNLSNMEALLHPTTWMFCINGNWPSPLCSSSQDGGATWGPELEGAPQGCQSGGLTAHLVGSVDGNVVGDTMPAVLQSPVAHARAMFGAALVITSTFKAV